MKMITVMLAMISLISLASSVNASPIVAGFDGSTIGLGDNESSVDKPSVDDPFPIGFSINFFTGPRDSLYINSNGNVTFSAPFRDIRFPTNETFATTGEEMFAPFFSDVDPSGGGEVSYGSGEFGGNDAFGVNWSDVGFAEFPSGTSDERNSFQMLIVDRSSDFMGGDFDLVFNYGEVNWDRGDFNDSSVLVGFTNGTGQEGTFFELTGSGVSGAFLTDGSLSLTQNQLNSDVPGRYVFYFRNGLAEFPVAVPAPSTLTLVGLGLIAIGAVRSAGSRRCKAESARV